MNKRLTAAAMLFALVFSAVGSGLRGTSDPMLSAARAALSVSAAEDPMPPGGDGTTGTDDSGPIGSSPLSAAPEDAEESAEQRAFSGLSYVTDGIADTWALLPTGRGAVMLAPGSDEWTCSGPVRKSYILRSPVEGDPNMTEVFFVVAGPRPDKERETDVLTYDLDLSSSELQFRADGYRTLRFGVCFEEAEGEFPLTAVLETSDGTLTCDLTVRAHPIDGTGILYGSSLVKSDNGWSVVTMDLSAVTGDLRRLTVRIREEANPVNTFLSAPVLSTDQTEELRRAALYSAFSFEEGAGLLSYGSGSSLTAQADRDGRVLISAPPAVPYDLPEGVPCCFEVILSSVSGSDGRLSVGIDFKDGLETVWSQPVKLSAGDNVCAIPVDLLSGIGSFSLLFEGVEPSTGFRIRSVRIYTGGHPSFSGNDWLGKLTRIERSGDTVVFAGSMVTDAVRKFAGSKLRFYAMPSPILLNGEEGAFFTPGGSVPLPESAVHVWAFKLSTMFESRLTLPASLPVNADSCVFFACVPDPEIDGSVLLLSAPRYADAAGRTTSEAVSSFGLADTFPAGVFESNAFHILTDVSLDGLLSASGGTSVAYAVPGETSPRSASLDPSILSSLDRDVEFYLSAGIRVYLRFRIDAPIPGLTAPDARVPDTDSPASAALWCALVRFFAARYPDASGFVIPGPVNDAEIAGIGSKTAIGAWAETLSHLCRLTYNAAARIIPDLAVCLPIDETKSESAVHSRVFLTLLARRIAQNGTFPWALLSLCGSDSSAPAGLKLTLSQLDSLSLPGPEDLLYVYQLAQSTLNARYAEYLAKPASERSGAFAPSEMAVELYRNFVKACGSGARAVFFSPAGLNQRYDHAFYDVLKQGAGDRDAIYRTGIQTDMSYEGFSAFDLWDFTDKYYSLDWIPGGGSLSCATELSDAFSASLGEPARVLSVSYQESEDGVAGIVMRNLKPTADLTDVEALVFDLRLNGGGEDTTVSLVFTVGTDDRRAEFHVDEIRCGEILRLSCPLTGWDDRRRADFVSIAVYAKESVTLELSKVSAVSAVLTPEELAAVFSPAPEPEEDRDVSWILPVLVFVTAASFAVFVLLTRRDSEGEGAAEPDERTPQRRRI